MCSYATAALWPAYATYRALAHISGPKHQEHAPKQQQQQLLDANAVQALPVADGVPEHDSSQDLGVPSFYAKYFLRYWTMFGASQMLTWGLEPWLNR